MDVSKRPPARVRVSLYFCATGLAASLIFAMFLNGLNAILHYGTSAFLAFAGLVSTQDTSLNIDLGWYPPKQTQINNLTTVMEGEGIYGWLFNSSDTPDEIYGTYNWCNMPHVRKQEYRIPSANYELVYVEVIQRHHKRTPYSSNAFPVEPTPWECSNTGLFYHSQPLAYNSTFSTIPSYWKITPSIFNPLPITKLTGSCLFPQITLGGLSDSHLHGVDLYSVYSSLLPLSSSSVQFRVTTNSITTQIASALLSSFPFISAPYPLVVQPPALDSLEPKYSCPLSSNLFSSIQSNAHWKKHLTLAKPLYDKLDGISGVAAGDEGFHVSMDHYYDNLSAKQCHSRGLPCSVGDKNKCISHKDAETVYRIGQWEYDYIYRSSGPETLKASLGSMGVWIAELAENIRDVVDGNDGNGIKYRHNVAHDGSMSRVLSILQVDEMVWPGMGSEIVFELWRENEKGKYAVRVLWGGKVLRSSNPSLGEMDMIDVDVVLGYFDGLVGKGAEKVRGLCGL
ncbi:histidine phosphatase superfamily [Cladorrhinum sp. PSN259]|nr:histidine phosphatase superfamily [Cladorrhinum sp. PSN259]